METEVERSRGFRPLRGGTEIFRGKLQRIQVGGPNGTRSNLHNSSARFYCSVRYNAAAASSGKRPARFGGPFLDGGPSTPRLAWCGLRAHSMRIIRGGRNRPRVPPG